MTEKTIAVVIVTYNQLVLKKMIVGYGVTITNTVIAS